MASYVWRRAASRRSLAASTMNRELSARIASLLAFLERLQGGNDPVEALLHLAVVGGQPQVPVAFGHAYEDAVVLRLLPLHRQELDRGLEAGHVRQALGCGQSCCGGRPQ